MDAPEDLVPAAMREIYAGALTGDRARSDAHIDPSCTFFDSHAMPLIRGLRELQAVRDARDDDVGGATIEMEPLDLRVDGDLALLLHRFRLLEGGAVAFTARNTSVWRRDGSGRWLLLHNHEDVVADGTPV